MFSRRLKIALRLLLAHRLMSHDPIDRLPVLLVVHYRFTFVEIMLAKFMAANS